MRIIDADALKAEFDKNCAMECACCDHATCNHVGNAVGCGLVDAAPTIDAIPVEWIRAKMDEQKREADKCIGNAAFTLAVIAPTEYLISEWHKEQEAR